METVEFDKLVFQEIFQGELDEDFDFKFISIFGISYKEFLQLKLEEYKKSTKDMAKYIGIKEKDLIHHLKTYQLIKTVDATNLKGIIKGNLFVYILKAVLATLGTIPIFYLVGYLILYGYYFGQADNALLDIVMKNVPLNRVSCYIAGFIFSGVVAFFISLYRLKGVGRTFLIFGFAYFLFASTVSLSLTLISTNSSLTFASLMKFMVVWLIPLVTALFLTSAYYLTNMILKHYKIIVVVMLVSLFIPIVLSNIYGLIPSIIIYFIIVILLSAAIVKIVERYPFVSTSKKRTKKVQRKEKTRYRFSIPEFFFFILFTISLSIVIIAPILSFIFLSTGNYISSTLSLVNLTASEEIRVKDNIINGKLVTEDDQYLYISTTSRTLLKISKDSSIQISKPNEMIVYSGNSKEWTITIHVFLRDNELWYSGVFNKINYDQTTEVTYQLDNLDKITIIHTDERSEYYLLDRLSPNSIEKFDFVNLSWRSADGSIVEDKVLLSVSKVNN